MTDTTMTDHTRAAAATAADEGKHVAGVAQGEATKVVGEAAAQARSLAGEATTQVAEQVADQTRVQRDKLVGTLGSLGDDLDQMAERGNGGLAADVAREVAGHARSLTSYLDGREPGDLLEDVRDFARRRPGTFLLGALAAGVVAGRLARGVKDAGPTSSPSSPAQPQVPAPTFGTTPPVSPAVTSEPGFPPPAAAPAFATPPAYAGGQADGFGTQPGSPA
ncbi:hypothetical protein [Nocardioides rubriscoriae]|uniref:hypothetical protein n=1 Tax=Nocardioides rubriscoriae TaxID=642762 RepID=UPI0011E0507A|nr:hypothetical protein [Nocardioides rubriscoriae]